MTALAVPTAGTLLADQHLVRVYLPQLRIRSTRA